MSGLSLARWRPDWGEAVTGAVRRGALVLRSAEHGESLARQAVASTGEPADPRIVFDEMEKAEHDEYACGVVVEGNGWGPGKAVELVELVRVQKEIGCLALHEETS